MILTATGAILEDSKTLAEQKVENDAVVALTLRKAKFYCVDGAPSMRFHRTPRIVGRQRLHRYSALRAKSRLFTAGLHSFDSFPIAMRRFKHIIDFSHWNLAYVFKLWFSSHNTDVEAAAKFAVVAALSWLVQACAFLCIAKDGTGALYPQYKACASSHKLRRES
ncbi:hypothetical protein AKJ16_DCAP02501 [Drosera capensis]